MANNVFGASSSTQLIKVDKARITIDDAVLMALNVTITYQRPVSDLPVLAEDHVIAVGKASGVINAETVLIPGSSDLTEKKFITGDLCEGKTLNITYVDGCAQKTNKPVTCDGCVASSLSITMQGGRGYVASGVQIVFTSMKFE